MPITPPRPRPVAEMQTFGEGRGGVLFEISGRSAFDRMSVKLMTAVFELKLPPGPKLVLLKIADFAADDGSNTFQSIEFIAAHTSQGERTVRRHRQKFESDGVLIVDGVRNGRRGRLKVFRLDIERARELYGVIDGAKAAKMAARPKNDNVAKSGRKAANSNATTGQSLAGDSSRTVIESSRAREAGPSNGPPASARGPDGDGCDRQAMIAEWIGSLLPKIQEAVGDQAFQAFGGGDMKRVCNQGTVGRLVIGQPTRLLRDLTLQHHDAIAEATGLDVEFVIHTGVGGWGSKPRAAGA